MNDKNGNKDYLLHIIDMINEIVFL